jgi:hypothetical protein
MVQNEKTWTAREIIKAVNGFNGGCASGKASFLQTMGIREVPIPRKDDKDGLYVVRFTVDARLETMRAYFGVEATVKSSAERALHQAGHLMSGQYGIPIAGPVTVRRVAEKSQAEKSQTETSI